MTDSPHTYKPDEPIYQGARARDVLAEVLCQVIDDINTDPLDDDDPQVDQLAPSLRQLVMDQTQKADLPVCRHTDADINSLTFDILAALPDTERQALRQPPQT